jgi:hypothetical protein
MMADMDLTGSDSHESRGDGRIKTWFRFVPRENWLPFDTEGMWAMPVTADTAQIDNVPFLQDGLAQGDIVRYTADSDGLFWATERVEASGNCTVRVIPVPSGPLGRSAEAVHDRLRAFEIGGEVYSKEFPMVALNVLAEADLAGVKALLAAGQTQGWWHYDVSCLTDAWRNA